MLYDEKQRKLGKDLIQAVKKYNPKTGVADIEKLINDGAPVDYADEYQKTALHWAAKGGHLDVAKLLLQYKADVNTVDDQGNAALHSVLMNTPMGNVSVDVAKDMVNLLLNNGANLSQHGQYGYTPLHLATIISYPDIAKLLIEKEANIDEVDDEGKTPPCKEQYYKQKSPEFTLCEATVGSAVPSLDGIQLAA